MRDNGEKLCFGKKNIFIFPKIGKYVINLRKEIILLFICMKRIAVIAFLATVIFPFSVIAQDNGLNPRFTVTVTELSYQAPQKKKTTVGTVLEAIADAASGVVTNVNNEAYLPIARAQILSSIGNTRRLIVVDDPNQSTDYIIFGEVTSIIVNRKTEYNEWTDKKGRKYRDPMIYYSASVSASLTLKEMSSGVIVDSNQFQGTSYYSRFNSVDESVKKAINNMCSSIGKHYNEVFPIRAEIIERGEIKKDKQKEVYINVGSAVGIGKNDEFDVIVIDSIGGQQIRKVIGRLKVKEVMGDDVSLCKVNKGDKEVKAALDTNATLLIVSRR